MHANESNPPRAASTRVYALVLRASLGDPMSVIHVFSGFAHVLAEEEAAILGAPHDAPLEDLFAALMSGYAARIAAPVPDDEPVGWLFDVMRVLALRRKAGTPYASKPNPLQGEHLMNASNQTQIERIYLRHARELFRVAYEILGDYDYAEDVLHHALVELDESAGDVVTLDEEVHAYLIDIVMRLAHEKREDREREPPRSGVFPIRGIAPPTPPTPFAPAGVVVKKAA